MGEAESIVRTYVLRLWQEGHAMWRGHITDVATGERGYVDDIDGVVAFLVPRLEPPWRLGIRSRVRTWLKQRRTARERS
jgi:hypothetical protein